MTDARPDPQAAGYADRESIQPRAFAVRHMIIEAVKLRLGQPAQPREALRRVAQSVGVEYDSATRTFIVAMGEAEARRIPLDGLTLYRRGDTLGAAQTKGPDARHWDGALEENRRVIGALLDELVAHVRG